MERNDSSNLGAGGGQPEANEFSGSGTTPQQDNSFDFSGSEGTTGQTQSIRDRTREAFGNASGRLTDVGSTVRARAGSAKDKLVGALEAGADKLRQRGSQGGSAQLAGTVPEATAAIVGDGRVTHASDRLAGGMQATADWLRDADVDGLKNGIERQVKDHPGRTLLIAAGLGYLIGRAFRNRQ